MSTFDSDLISLLNGERKRTYVDENESFLDEDGLPTDKFLEVRNLF